MIITLGELCSITAIMGFKYIVDFKVLIKKYFCLLFYFLKKDNGWSVIHLSYVFWGFTVCLAFVVDFFGLLF